MHDEGHGYDLFGLSPAAVARAREIGMPLYRHYFRVTSAGGEHVPVRGGAILVPNHSGTLPIDAALLWLDVAAQTARVLRPIADRFVPRLPFISTAFARIGVVAGTHANVRCLLERDELIAIFPEGVTGPAKPFARRYHLQHWRVGHAEHAIRARVPIVPVGIVGVEEAWPVLARLPWKLFGSPYLPIPVTPLPLPLPVHIHYGKPLELHRRFVDADEPVTVEAAAQHVKRAVELARMRVLATSPLLADALQRAADYVLPVERAELARERSLHDVLYGTARTLRIDTVVHDSPDPELARRLLVACEHHPTIRRLVYVSTTDVYLRCTREPNLLDEDAPLDYERAAADLTVCARIGTSRLHIAVLRCAEMLAAGSQLFDYLASRVCLRPLGFDPMLNLLSVEDHAHACVLAARSDVRGIFNIPGADTLPLSRLIELAGRRDIPLPGPLLAPLYQLRTRVVGFEFRYDLHMRHFHFGGILAGTHARRTLGYVASHALKQLNVN